MAFNTDFNVIPAVDMKGGKCVQLVQGIPGSEVVSIDNPAKVARQWVDEGASMLHLIDLDGALYGERVNAPHIKEIAETCNVPIQVGGGIRTHKDVEDLLNLGVDKVILSTAAIQNPPLVKELADEFSSEAIIVSLDSKNGEVSTHGWTKQSGIMAHEAAAEFEQLGAGSILFTNIDSEGLLNGVNTTPTKKVIDAVNIPIIASGGVTTVQDIVALKQIGAWGVVVGTALYTHKFTLSDALKSVVD